MTGSNGFERALALVDGVQGWLTDAQARALYDAAQAVGPGGRIVEIDVLADARRLNELELSGLV